MVKELKRYFLVTPEGHLIRKIRVSNQPKGKKIIGAKHSNGYRVVGFKNRILYVHRIVFAIKKGYIPKMIDHINRNTSDNRIQNLRESTDYENQLNRGLNKNNKSGFSGLHYSTIEDRWRIQLRRNGKRLNLGSYKCKHEAIKVLKQLTGA